MIPMKPIDSILENTSFFIFSLFGLDINKSKLKYYSKENWKEFCNLNNFKQESEGLYIPASYTAYVRTDSPFLMSNIFHELYGHGLFVEHSVIGKELVDIINSNQEHNKQNDFLFNKINKQKFGICDYNIYNYEGFAFWLESILCEETDNTRIWNIKKDNLSKDYQDLFNHFKDAEEKLSRFGLISQMGFPKIYDNDKVLNSLQKLYGNNFSNIDFVVLYGSKRPNSDIDLFVVTDTETKSRNIYNNTFDIYELNRNDFVNLSKNLNISVTDPMFSGELIYGNRNNFEYIKNYLLNKPITEQDINHNLEQSEIQKRILPYISKDDTRLLNNCLGYIDSFKYNAIELSKGYKPLVVSNLKEVDRRK